MFGIRYLRFAPTEYVLHYDGGRLRREGPALAFFCYWPTAVVAAVPVGSADLPFAFALATGDFQSVTLQGQLTYRVAEPRKLAALLDYTLGEGLQRRGDDHEKLEQRLVQAVQVLAGLIAGRLPLREALTSAARFTAEVLAGLRQEPAVTLHGIEILNLGILALRPTPDMAKALEAEAREGLQRRADDAIYARRQGAIEQERRLKETELATEMAVAEKKRQMREAEIDGEVKAEELRARLVAQRTENERREAEARGYALEAVLKPVAALDPRALMALAAGQGDARTTIALAFQELAANAQKIGEVNISPELLQGLLKK